MRFNGTSQKTVASAPYKNNVRRLASVNGRDRNKPIGSIGAATRRSKTTRTESDTAPQHIVTNTSGWLAPRRGHSRRAKTTPPSPATARPAPVQSIREVRDGSRLSLMNRADSATTIAASGTFRKKTARQLTCSISQPPAMGPRADVMELKPDHVQIA